MCGVRASRGCHCASERATGAHASHGHMGVRASKQHHCANTHASHRRMASLSSRRNSRLVATLKLDILVLALATC
jgi:hypothetical protein